MNNKGFFLLETVVVAVLLLSAAGAVGLCQISSHMRVEAEDRMVAAFLAQKEMAAIEGGVAMTGLPREEDVMQNARAYHLVISVADTAAESLKRVAVEISWPADGARKTLCLEKLVKQND